MTPEEYIEKLKMEHPSWSRAIILSVAKRTYSSHFTLEEVRPKKQKVRYSPKQKAEYAVKMRMPEEPKWMQEWIDFTDNSIPIGKRRVAYVRYLTMTKGVNLDKAKYLSIKNIF